MMDEVWLHDSNDYRLPELTRDTIQVWVECILNRMLFEADLAGDDIEMKLFGFERLINVAVPYEFYARSHDKLEKSKRRSLGAA